MVEGTARKQPVRRRRIIERPRLTTLLDESQGRIKMLVAPAGYGKTTLARQWLEGKTSAWYTGTSASMDVAALAAGLSETIGAVVPGSGEALLERLSITSRPEVEIEVLAAMLADDLATWDTNAWLVIDDYHALAGASAAERFVEALLLEAPLNALILSRRRPSWTSSRRILYGEVFELDRADLAMNDAEARELLTQRSSDMVELIELARGWPAVLGLASVASCPPPDLTATPHLYRFFAEEIFQRIDPKDRDALCVLALFGVSSSRTAIQSLYPDHSERIVRAGVDHGFLTERKDGTLEMHPLLRSFLERKLMEGRQAAVRHTASRALEVLIEHELWDDAFTLIQRVAAVDLMPRLVEAAMEPLLAAGRSPTLRTWISYAEDDEPVIRLAAAQLAFRDGRLHEAEVLGEIAARSPDVADDIRARAHLVAARAAHVASREEQAGALFALAGASAVSQTLKRRAALGELIVAIELEREDAPALLRLLEQDDILDPGERLALADRRLSLESHYGLRVNLEAARAAKQLLPHVADPLARTSFRNVYGYTLAVSGYFAEAQEVTDEQLVDAEHHRLDFVFPYAYTVQALALCGLRNYVEAEEILDEAEQRAIREGDRTAYHVAWAVRSRLYIAQGAFDLVLGRPMDLDRDLTHQLRSEVKSAYALALAGVDRIEQARRLASAAQKASIGVETRICSQLAHAVAAFRESDPPSALKHARSALECATTTGMIEAFVCGYRGAPEVIIALLQDSAAHPELSRILALSGDADVVDTSADTRVDRSVLALSPREKEVLSLLAQGLSNSDIGKALFISPVTVKVHVRHIFEKLGVHSRAAAALRATQLSR
jgi:ATP/maltotriose-dependent transcriptional regulator MalT